MTADAELQRLTSAFRVGEKVYAAQGSTLYAALARAGADDPYILALCRHAMEGAPPVHLFTAVHYLLLGGAEDPLAHFFPTLTDAPAPADAAWPYFRRFCQAHEAELVHLLRTRSVQMTYADRSRRLLPPLCHVADLAGEPLNLIEIGCSAGVLLIFDRYAYELDDHGRVGPDDAPFVLKGHVANGPRLRIPRIGRRTGIDLNIIDTASADDRRWMLATCFPELKQEQAQLDRAMAMVAETDIQWYEGDALAHLPQALAETPDPVCVYHSACLFYWPPDARRALDEQLRRESRGRTIYRIGIEPSERLNVAMSGKATDGEGPSPSQPSGEISLTVYYDGAAESRIIAQSGSDYGELLWLG